MKVLEPGRKQKGWSHEYSCTGNGNGKGGCGAKLLVERRDIFSTSSSARDETTYYATFICSACGVPSDLPYADFTRLPFEPRPMTEEEKAIVHQRR